MDAIDAILTRRSIRKFKDKEIASTDLELILKAGMFAPTAMNQQPWQFIVINDKNLLNQIPDFHPHALMCKEAPVAILICADLNFVKVKDMWILDCAAATQNILLAAHAKKIGSVWISILYNKEREEGIKKLLNLPKTFRPISLIAIGYPNQNIPKVDRFNKERIHYNSF